MKKEALFVLVVSILCFSIAGASSEKVDDDIHLNIKATDSNGNVQTGTFDFTFNISNNSTNTCDSSNIVYSDSSSLTTNSNGVISYYLSNVSLNYSQQHWLCQYRDGSLKETTKIASSPRALSVDSGDVQPSGTLNLTGVTGLFEFLGSVTNRITTLFVKDINASGTITADSFETTGGGSIGGAPSAVNVTSGTFFGNMTNSSSVSSSVKNVVDGSKTGYAKANAICDAEFNGSMICTEADIIKAYEAGNVGISGANAWVVTGGSKYNKGSSVNDCSGFTTSDGIGNYWAFDSSSGGSGSAVGCSTDILKLACCST